MNRENPIVIENAGLVLFAPFLPHFFRNLGYLDVMRFLDGETHAKAIYLLEYMANGENGITGDLSLNALLCGWPHGRPVPPPPPLSDMEKQQAIQVVEALCAHWTALGRVAVDNLRSLFLKRSGSLEMGLKPVLTIASQPHDMLLRNLPWVYAVTRTPWCEPIEVCWG